jgi:hypothetical protein
MQSNKVPLAWMLYTRKHLTCRANHRHCFIIAQLETARGPANGFWHDCRPKILTIDIPPVRHSE